MGNDLKRKMWVQSLGQEDPLEKEMATHSSIFAWRIPCTEEPGGLQSMGSQSQTRLSMHAFAKELKAKVTTTFCWVVAGHDS